jgi:hypothetical protein
MSSFNSYLYARGVAERFLPDEYRLENNQLTVPTTFILSRMPSGAVLSLMRSCLGLFTLFAEL